MVDSKASVEQGIIDKIRSRETPVASEEDSLSAAGCVSAIRNSSLARWRLLHGEAIPVPRLSEAEERAIARLVEEMHAAKDANPAADTEPMEWELDRLVYDLYGLTEEEGAAVERALGLIHQTDEEEDAALGRMAAEAIRDPENIADKASEAEFHEIMRSWRSEAGD